MLENSKAINENDLDRVNGGSNYDDIRDITQDEVIAKRKAAGIM